MLLRHKLLESENHTGYEPDDSRLRAGVRTDVEDALCQALEDTLRDQRLDAFRSFVKRYGRELFAEESYTQILGSDDYAWIVVHQYTTNLARMVARWERSANILHRAGYSWGDSKEQIGF